MKSPAIRPRPRCFERAVPYVFLSVLLIFGAARGYVSRGPWLQLPTQTSMNIRWLTMGPEFCTVKWGLSSIEENTMTEVVPGTVHSVTLDNLQPGTAYRYQVVSMDASTTDVYTFKTAPTDLTGDLKIAIIGDSQLQLGIDYGTNRLMAEQPDIILHNGDNVIDVLQDRGTNAYRPIFAQVPLMVSVGNHDLDGGINGKYNAWETWFGIPDDRPISTKGDCYAFDYAGVKFLVYSNGYTYTSAYDPYWDDAMVDKFFTPYADQAEFFRGQLQQAQGRYRFIMMFGHRFMLGGGMGELNSFMQPDNPYGVDLITNGHGHRYHSDYLTQYDLWSFESAGFGGQVEPSPFHSVYVTLSSEGDSTRVDVVAKKSQDGSIIGQWSYYSKQPPLSSFEPGPLRHNSAGSGLIGVFADPVARVVHVTLPQRAIGGTRVCLVDMRGRLVRAARLSGTCTISLSTEGLSRGTFVVRADGVPSAHSAPFVLR